MFIKFTFFLILILSITLPAGIGFARSPEINETVLENGLKVITIEMHTAPIIYSQLSYKVGSRNEVLGKTGLAHITEHIMFKGTPTYPKGKISRLIKDNAGVFNAFTSNDITVYYEQMPKNKIDLALAIEADRMHNCLIDSAELMKELEVIKEERRMRMEDNSLGAFSEEFNSVAFKSSPNRWPIIGWMNDIENTTRTDVWNFYRTYYSPNNATLVLAGDFENSDMLAKVKKYFGSIPRGPAIPIRSFEEPAQTSKRIITLKRPDVKTGSIQMSWHAPAIGHPDNAALKILAFILGGTKSSRLYKRLVQDENLAMRASAGLRIGKDPWLFTISIEAREKNIKEFPKVEKIIIEEIRDIQQNGVTDYEMQQIKNLLAYNEVFENMKISKTGGRISSYETYLDWRFYEEWKEQRKSTTIEDIKRVAVEYIDPEVVTIGYLLPDGTEAAKISGEIPQSEESSDADKFYYLPPDSLEDTVDELDVIKPQDIAPRIQQAKLANNIPVYFIHDTSFPVFSLRGFIRTGNCPEDVEKPGIGALTSRMLVRGTHKYSDEYLIERMNFLPFSFYVSGSVEQVRFSGSVLSEYADSLLKYGIEMLSHPAFPEDKLTIIRDQMIASLRKASAGAGWKSSRFLFETVYGKEHPYGRVASGNVESLKKLTPKDLREFHQTYFCPQHTVLCVLSDLTLPEVLDKLNATIGRWKHQTPPQLTAFPEPQKIKGRIKQCFPMPEKSQADVRLGGTLVPHGHPDSEAIDLAVHILGGSSLSSRLGVSIRDEQGLVYRVGLKTRQRMTGGLWFLQAGTKGENAPQLVRSAISEIERMRREEVTAEELLAAKRYFIGILPMVVETPLDILDQMHEMVRHNLPLTDFDTYSQRVMKVNSKDILRVMKKYFDTENMVIVGAGPLGEDVFREF
ncbi:insulinase family protein [candidate division KSB1 bacterium]|nr:insulinase family protein [candidate division KSB1 bacterium]